MSTSETSLSKKNQSPTLTKNQKIVLDLLENSAEPLKAYSILASLQKEGLKSPLQVYRALDKLVELGKIHKIESKNAFVACKNSNCRRDPRVSRKFAKKKIEIFSTMKCSSTIVLALFIGKNV